MKKRSIDSRDIFAHSFFEDEASPFDDFGKGSVPHTDRFASPTKEGPALEGSAMQNYNNSI